MKLNQFLDAAYALLVDEYRHLGSSLVESLDRTREYAAGNRKGRYTASGNEELAAQVAPQSDLKPEELRNENAMAMFEQMMGDVKFA
jgi:hypothetical protein